MSGYYPRSKRKAPQATLSDAKAFTASAPQQILYNSASVQGCYLYGIIIQSCSALLANSTLKIYDGTTEKAQIALNTTADIPYQTVFSFGAPIPIEGLLKLKTASKTNTFTLRAVYEDF